MTPPPFPAWGKAPAVALLLQAGVFSVLAWLAAFTVYGDVAAALAVMSLATSVVVLVRQRVGD